MAAKGFSPGGPSPKLGGGPPASLSPSLSLSLPSSSDHMNSFCPHLTSLTPEATALLPIASSIGLMHSMSRFTYAMHGASFSMYVFFVLSFVVRDMIATTSSTAIRPPRDLNLREKHSIAVSRTMSFSKDPKTLLHSEADQLKPLPVVSSLSTHFLNALHLFAGL